VSALPVLYSFRRCPYAMRARLALAVSGQVCELREVVLRSTWKPAQMISKPQHGHLTVGADADIAVFRVMEGDFQFADSDKGLHGGRRRLFCEMTLLGGKVMWDWNGRTGVDYRTLGPAYGVRPGEGIVLPPVKGQK